MVRPGKVWLLAMVPPAVWSTVLQLGVGTRVSKAHSMPASATYRAWMRSAWFLETWGSVAAIDMNAIVSIKTMTITNSARAVATPRSSRIAWRQWLMGVLLLIGCGAGPGPARSRPHAPPARWSAVAPAGP